MRVLKDLVISVQALTKFYGSHRGIEGIDLAVRQGEIFGLLGPNGAGKTTLIRIMLDLIFFDKKLGDCSKRMKQKILIVQALMFDPDLLPEVVKTISVLSVFHYFIPSTIIDIGQPQWMHMLHVITFSVVFLFAAAYTFDRRDMPS